MLALGGKELGPGDDLGMLLEQRTALAFGHTAPNTELNAIVERVGATFQNYRAMSANNCCLALGGAAYEEFIWIGLAATRLGYPRDAGLGLRAVDNAVC
jgi:hypothetical protein